MTEQSPPHPQETRGVLYMTVIGPMSAAAMRERIRSLIESEELKEVAIPEKMPDLLLLNLFNSIVDD